MPDALALKILVIRRDNIGDLVCTTPLISALRLRHPRAHIAALVNTYNRQLLEGHPDLDAVYAYDKAQRRLLALRRCGWRAGSRRRTLPAMPSPPGWWISPWPATRQPRCTKWRRCSG